MIASLGRAIRSRNSGRPRPGFRAGERAVGSGHGPRPQAAREADRLVGIVEGDLDLVTGAARADTDVGAEGGAERVGDAGAGGLLVGVDGRAAAGGATRRRVGIPGALLEDADRPAAVDGGAGEAAAVGVIVGEQEGA